MTYPTIADFAYDFAKAAHEGQFRMDGRPYFSHPARVAVLVNHYKGPSSEVTTLAAAAYCHDLLEDTSVSYYDLVNAFGYPTASLVLELTTNPEMKSGVGSKKEYLAYKLKHMTHWALVIKLCDRLDNLSDLSGADDKWRKKYLDETIYILQYLEANRELTSTHKNIIADLWRICNVVHEQLECNLL